MTEQGILYLCATPIGNLEDMTFRAVRTLKEVDLIAAEDTRRTRKLLAHFDIHTPMIRYDENCKKIAGDQIIKKLLEGKSVACVSDAGVPAISDPGADLAKLAADSGIKISPVPGANAALSALICSSLDTTKFTFAGFLPKSAKNRREVLEKLSSREETLIFYEAPHRIKKILEELADFFGDRPAAIARELTKIHEEFLRGNLRELANALENPQGEFVIVVQGTENFSANEKNLQENSPEDFLEVYKNLVESGLDKKSAIRETAKKFNLSRREIYNAVVKSQSDTTTTAFTP